VGGDAAVVTIRLRGDRVVLRPFREPEFDVLWGEETKDRGDYDAPWNARDEAARERVHARVARSGTWREGKVLDLAVEADGELIGDVQARHTQDMTPPGLFELGIGLFVGTRGKGYGTEALTLITRYLFDEEHASRVQLGTDVENVSMRRSAEKAGFRYEGVMRGFWPVDGAEPRDYALYARTRRDHEGGRKRWI
jgi:ribosomal-protein-alanine N-acetyltransferase